MWKWDKVPDNHREVDKQQGCKPTWREKRIENYIRRRLRWIIFFADRNFQKGDTYRAMLSISPARIDIIGDKKQFTETTNSLLRRLGICMVIEYIDDDVDENTDRIPDSTRLIKVYFIGYEPRMTL